MKVYITPIEAVGKDKLVKYLTNKKVKQMTKEPIICTTDEQISEWLKEVEKPLNKHK